jgi:hypothetical protein
MGFGIWSYSREPLLEGNAVPENSVKKTGQGTLGGLHQYSLTEGKKKAKKCGPECDCEKCEADRVLQSSKDEHEVAEPAWQPWEVPQPASPLDEFRRLTGLGGDDASYLPSPLSTGNRNVYRDGRRGILDPGSEPVEEAAKQSPLGKAPVSEEFFREADPEEKEKSAPEGPEPGRTAGRATRSRKDGIPRAGKQMRSEIEVAIRKLKAKYGLPRDTGWKAPPAPKPEPPEDKN